VCPFLVPPPRYQAPLAYPHPSRCLKFLHAAGIDIRHRGIVPTHRRGHRLESDAYYAGRRLVILIPRRSFRKDIDITVTQPSVTYFFGHSSLGRVTRTLPRRLFTSSPPRLSFPLSAIFITISRCPGKRGPHPQFNTTCSRIFNPTFHLFTGQIGASYLASLLYLPDFIHHILY